MLCSPLNNSSSNNNNNGKLSDTNNNNSNNNNNTIKQQNYEHTAIMIHNSSSQIASTTIREIKSRNIGSLSPLCQSSISTGGQLLIERRQAISMERLNNIQSCRGGGGGVFTHTCRDSKENGGSLSSGGSNSSLDDSTTDEQQLPTVRVSGLTRSASRVNRFKSAKEFFERLSNVNHQSPQFHLQNRLRKPQLPDRPRGTVVERYTAVTSAAKAASQANLTTIVSPPRSRLQPPVTSQYHQQQQQQQQQPQSQLHLPQPQSYLQQSHKVNSSSDLTTTQSGNSSYNNSNSKSNNNINISNNSNNNISDVNTSVSISKPTTVETSSISSRFSPNVEIYNFTDSPPHSPKLTANNIVFEGDNVIVGNGSLLIKRNKQLKIKFDENSTLTFEYPSEEALLAEPESPAESPVPAPAPAQPPQPQPLHQTQVQQQTNMISNNPALSRKSK